MQDCFEHKKPDLAVAEVCWQDSEADFEQFFLPFHFATADIHFEQSETDFVIADIHFEQPDTDFVIADIHFEQPDTDFAVADIHFEQPEIDFAVCFDLAGCSAGNLHCLERLPGSDVGSDVPAALQGFQQFPVFPIPTDCLGKQHFHPDQCICQVFGYVRIRTPVSLDENIYHNILRCFQKQHMG